MKESTIKALVESVALQLAEKYQDKQLCTQYAWWVLESITLHKKSSLIAKHTVTLSQEQQEKLELWIDKQVKENIPLQYLIGSVPFGDCEILTEPPTLIPRPETEEWCLNLIDRLAHYKTEPLTILDLCTGSGCLAIALAKAFPHATIFASDISESALELAQKNALHNKVSHITFINSDIFNEIPPELKFDIIISNPPYISESEWKEVDASVKEWEDPAALMAPENGLSIIKNIVQSAQFFLKKNNAFKNAAIPQLYIEIGHQQGKAVSKLLKDAGFINIVIEKDLQKKDRVVLGCIADEGSIL